MTVFTPASPPVFLDRDGVVVVETPVPLADPEAVRLEEGALAGLRLLHAAGSLVLVVTNQGAIARGRLTASQVEAVHVRIRSLVADGGGSIADFLVCPHQDADLCACRKPLPGLLLTGADRHGFAPATAWMVGDMVRDIQAGQAAGCRTAFVTTGKGAGESRRRPDIPAFPSLEAFARSLFPHG